MAAVAQQRRSHARIRVLAQCQHVIAHARRLLAVARRHLRDRLGRLRAIRRVAEGRREQLDAPLPALADVVAEQQRAKLLAGGAPRGAILSANGGLEGGVEGGGTRRRRAAPVERGEGRQAHGRSRVRERSRQGLDSLVVGRKPSVGLHQVGAVAVVEPARVGQQSLEPLCGLRQADGSRHRAFEHPVERCDHDRPRRLGRLACRLGQRRDGALGLRLRNEIQRDAAAVRVLAADLRNQGTNRRRVEQRLAFERVAVARARRRRGQQQTRVAPPEQQGRDEPGDGDRKRRVADPEGRPQREGRDDHHVAQRSPGPLHRALDQRRGPRSDPLRKQAVEHAQRRIVDRVVLELRPRHGAHARGQAQPHAQAEKAQQVDERRDRRGERNPDAPVERAGRRAAARPGFRR